MLTQHARTDAPAARAALDIIENNHSMLDVRARCARSLQARDPGGERAERDALARRRVVFPFARSQSAADERDRRAYTATIGRDSRSKR
jgi:hypothetical protein